MEELVNLVNLFQRTKFKVSGMMAIILEPSSEMERFYDAMAKGLVQTDEDAKLVFPEYAQNPNRLSTIKGKLKERLNDSILLLDFRESAFTERQHAFYACSKKWATAMTLLSKNARENGIGLLENLLRQTLRFEFTELTVDILRTLRLHYGILEGDQKRFDQIEQQINEYEGYWVMERKTEGCYAELVTRYVRNKSQQEVISRKARAYFEMVKPFMGQCHSFKVQFFGRLLEILIYDSVQDYANTARLCEEALDFFSKKDYKSSIVLQVFNFNLFTCYMHLRQYDKCMALTEQHQGLFEEGTYNWFKVQELYFFAHMQSGQYAKGLEIHHKVSEHPNLEKMPAAITELWKIFEAYLCLLARGQMLEAPQLLSRFKMSKFLNEVPLYAKDKSGVNIAIMIAELLYEVQSGKWSKLIDRTEAIGKYRVRYIAPVTQLRSYCFVRILELLPKASFQWENLVVQAESIVQSLGERANNVLDNNNIEIEIIPYEKLWEVLLRALGKSPDVFAWPKNLPRPTSLNDGVE